MTEIVKLGPRPAPHNYQVLKPVSIIRKEICINCGVCAEICIYNCHKRDENDCRVMQDPLEGYCKGCLACIQHCPRSALIITESSIFKEIGNNYYTPFVINSILEQASAGKIPVSGSGYDGYFDGKDYDNIWTDMSEIVRPTRDGIHGREDISTKVNLGSFISDISDLSFNIENSLTSLIPLNREISIPILFSTSSYKSTDSIIGSLALAASKLTTYTFIDIEKQPDNFMEYFNHLAVSIEQKNITDQYKIVERASIIQIKPGDNPIDAMQQVKSINPQTLTIHLVKAKHKCEKYVLELVKNGAEIIHIEADRIGRGSDGITLLDAVNNTHNLLVDYGLRDRVTVIASGGIVKAEHIPKIIILGADAVVLDVALMIALECIICENCLNEKKCPRDFENLNKKWGASRVINLMHSYKDQLLEVLGAMGIRDVRRLRGEVGRAIFTDQAKEDFLKRLNVYPKKAAMFSSYKDDKSNNKDELKRKYNILLKEEFKAPNRVSSPLSAYIVKVDKSRCIRCGLCESSCPYGVHQRIQGKMDLNEPKHNLCIGHSCLKNDWCCVYACEWQALSINNNILNVVLGDKRWTFELLHETYRQANTGKAPVDEHKQQKGNSKGGFDILDFKQVSNTSKIKKDDIDLSIPLNKRKTGYKIEIPIPIYGGGMSYGSISLNVMKGRASAAKQIGTFTCTGEGGYPKELVPYADNIITQIATGLFGVREETINRSKIVELKYAQGAKPGLGGHLLGEKNTKDIAEIRETVPGTPLFSPFPFHSVYSVEDHKKHLDWIKTINPEVLISVKVSTPADVDMVTVGSYYAGANIIHIDGAYGGTGAAPDIAKKNISQPVEYAIAQVHDFLVSEQIRDEIVLIASGGIRTPDDVLKSIALGADGVVIGTAELIAIDCVRCKNCERDRGCPNGIVTTDPELSAMMTPDWIKNRILNLYKSWSKHMIIKLAKWGMTSITQLRGRRDLLAVKEKKEEVLVQLKESLNELNKDD